MARFTFVVQVLLVNCLFLLISAEEDYYQRLNVPRTATTNEIKRKFRQMAKSMHPDQNKDDPDAGEKFQKLSQAYEVLTNAEKREVYDKYGEAGLKESGSRGHYHDPVASFFGFGFDFGDSRGSDEVLRGDTIVMDLSVTLEELYTGDFVEITRVKLDKQNTKGTRKCRCRREMRTTQLAPGQFRMHQVDICDDCPNVAFNRVDRHLELEIEVGMRDGYLYPFVSEGEPHIDGDYGDLKFRIKQRKHERFQRRGDDLYTNVTLTLLESLIGYHLSLTHLDGHQVILKSEKMTPPGTIIHKPGEGMPNHENPRVYGSLYITVDVAYPTDGQLSDEDREKCLGIFPHQTGFNRSANNEPSPANVYNGLDMLPRTRVSKVTS